MKKKRKYEVQFPINWENGHCCLCKFPLIIYPTKFDVSLKNMSYRDFIILKEHRFLRNIFSEDLLKKSVKKY